MKKLEFAGLQNVWHVTDQDEFFRLLKGRSTLLFVQTLADKFEVEKALTDLGFTVKPVTYHSQLTVEPKDYVLLAAMSHVTGYRVSVDQVAFFKSPSIPELKQGQGRVHPYYNQADDSVVTANAYVYHPLPNGREMTNSVLAAL